MSKPSKPSKHFCETGVTKLGEYQEKIHNYGDTPYERCSQYYDEYKAYNSWVAEIVFASSTYKLIKYYYSENEGAFEITHDGITNKNGSFKYEIVDTQSGGGISFKDGENTTSTYTKLFFVIYNGTAKFAANNMKVRECTSATNNGSYTYDGLNGNSLTSIKFTNMKADRSKLNAITSVEEALVVAPAVAPAAPAAQRQRVDKSKSVVEKIPVEKITKSITDRIEIKSCTLNDIVTNKIYLKGNENEKATILKFFKPTIPIKYMESSSSFYDDINSKSIQFTSPRDSDIDKADAIKYLNHEGTEGSQPYIGLDLGNRAYKYGIQLIADIILPNSFTEENILKLVYGSIDDPENFNINITNGVMTVNKQ